MNVFINKKRRQQASLSLHMPIGNAMARLSEKLAFCKPARILSQKTSFQSLDLGFLASQTLEKSVSYHSSLCSFVMVAGKTTTKKLSDSHNELTSLDEQETESLGNLLETAKPGAPSQPHSVRRCGIPTLPYHIRADTGSCQRPSSLNVFCHLKA